MYERGTYPRLDKQRLKKKKNTNKKLTFNFIIKITTFQKSGNMRKYEFVH